MAFSACVAVEGTRCIKSFRHDRRVCLGQMPGICKNHIAFLLAGRRQACESEPVYCACTSATHHAIHVRFVHPQ